MPSTFTAKLPVRLFSPATVAMSAQHAEATKDELHYVQYAAEKEEEYLPAIRQLISKDLSEPYSIYVYRYFLYQWGELCYMVGSTGRRREDTGS